MRKEDQDPRPSPDYYYGDGVTATGCFSDMKPGDSVNGFVRLRNDGSIIDDLETQGIDGLK